MALGDYAHTQDEQSRNERTKGLFTGAEFLETKLMMMMTTTTPTSIEKKKGEGRPETA